LDFKKIMVPGLLEVDELLYDSWCLIRRAKQALYENLWKGSDSGNERDDNDTDKENQERSTGVPKFRHGKWHPSNLLSRTRV
jgi:hypothetical protein